MRPRIEVEWHIAHECLPRIVLRVGERSLHLTGGEAEDLARDIEEALRQARAEADEAMARYYAAKERAQ